MKNFYTVNTEIGTLLIQWEGNFITKIAHTKNLKNSEKIPAFVKSLGTKIQKHLAGTEQDFTQTPIDLNQFAPFQKKVYQKLIKLPAGKTISYSELARMAGSEKAARAVGMCMRNNPFLIVIPCHRVIGKNKKLVGFNMPGGIEVKARMLEIEAK